MSVTFENVVHERFGNCLKMSNGVIDLFATLDFGPRIIHFGLAGDVNEFFEDVNDDISAYDNSFGQFHRMDSWHMYGGHRLWISPETMPKTYFPDNDKISYIVENKNAVRLIQLPQAYTQVQLEMVVSFGDNHHQVGLTHYITNLGAFDITLAPWALTVMAKGGLQVIPLNTEDTGYLPNGNMVLWPYTKLNDSRLTLCEKYIALRQDPEKMQPFKLGFALQKGFTAYFNHNHLFLKKFAYDSEKSYPDYNVNYETYTNHHIMELETLGFYETVAPFDQVSHFEQWEIYPDISCPCAGDTAITKALAPFVSIEPL